MLVVSCMHVSWPVGTAWQVTVSHWWMYRNMSKSIKYQKEKTQVHYPFIPLYKGHLLLHFRIVVAPHRGILR
jgi:hypothetical protein